VSIARVALDVPIVTLFDYRIGAHTVQPGQLVVVPFGNRRLVGMVFELNADSQVDNARLRFIQSILPVDPLPADVLSLIQFASTYYCCPIGEAAFTSLPAPFRQPRYVRSEKQKTYTLPKNGYDTLLAHIPRRAILLRRILEVLSRVPALTREEARQLSPRAPAALEQWVNKGWIESRLAQDIEQTLDGPVQKASGPSLTTDQANALVELEQGFGKYSPWLLEGITGSGKTEIYFQLIVRALERGQQTLLLVPEINLTPQLEARFHARFDARRLVTLHSNLASGERARHWLAAASGQAGVVLGTRLSVFAPMPRLGLIIVDEEHDASFKQQEGLRYSARDLALVRAQRLGIPIVLGSATPSLETFHNAQKKKFRHLRLSSRPGAKLPQVRLIETQSIAMLGGLSKPVLDAIRQRLERGEQSLVFLNRRGFAPVVVCGACGWVGECGRCSARLVWHLKDAVLRCHYCGHEQSLPRACPTCGDQDLHGLGQGTQRLEQTLVGHFPAARILRIDRDSTRRKGTWDGMLEKIHGDAVDILVGTQMLAKGHDFPNLTLVVIANPDAALYAADFRASEKLFQQLMQVSGRAGRAHLPGEVLVQTRFAAHPVYQALASQNFPELAVQMLAERQQAGFPPFVAQALLRAEAVSEGTVNNFLERAAKEGASLIEQDVTMYDAVPATMARIAGRHRAHLLVQSPLRPALQRFLQAWTPRLEQLKVRNVRWTLDVDPLEL
jgi:primosomal protein N' (replication factor Y) (superfamily II helicase)